MAPEETARTDGTKEKGSSKDYENERLNRRTTLWAAAIPALIALVGGVIIDRWDKNSPQVQ